MANKFWKITLLALAALGIWVRAPQLITYPRFWAEEGSRYVYFALEHGFWATLFWHERQAGYLDITRHFAAGLASLVPLEYAPYITTSIAFFIQLLACFIVIYGHSMLFNDYVKKCLGCLIILFAPAVIDEVWLNTINSMTWFGLIGFLIAVERLSIISRSQVIFYRIVLTIGALSGVYVCMLAPLYGLIAVRERTRNTTINAGIVFSGLIAQSLALMYSVSSESLNDKRFTGLDLFDTAYAIFWNHIAEAIVGHGVVSKLTEIPFGLTVVLALFVVILVVIIWYIHARELSVWKENWQILFSWACFSAGTTLASLNHGSAGRYAVLPGWMILFLLLNCSRPFRLKLLGFFSTCLLSAILGIGLMNYSLEGRTNCDGHNWRKDIELGSGVSQKVIPICPQGWFFTLLPIHKE
jgi:hypothetical protein